MTFKSPISPNPAPSRFRWTKWFLVILGVISFLILTIVLFNVFAVQWMWNNSNHKLKLWAASIAVANRSLIGMNKDSMRALWGLPLETTGPLEYMTARPTTILEGPYLTVNLNPDHSIRHVAGYRIGGISGYKTKVTPFDASKWEKSDFEQRMNMTMYLESQWREGKLKWKTDLDADSVFPVHEFLDTWEYPIDIGGMSLHLRFDENGSVIEAKLIPWAPPLSPG